MHSLPTLIALQECWAGRRGPGSGLHRHHNIQPCEMGGIGALQKDGLATMFFPRIWTPFPPRRAGAVDWHPSLNVGSLPPKLRTLVHWRQWRLPLQPSQHDAFDCCPFLSSARVTLPNNENLVIRETAVIVKCHAPSSIASKAASRRLLH